MSDTNGNGVKKDGAHIFGTREVRGRREALAKIFFNALVANQSMISPEWSRFGMLGGKDGRPKTDLDAECGYPTDEEMTPDWYRKVYSRWGLAARVVNIWPDECWAVHPEVYQNDRPGVSPFDKAVTELVRKTLLFHYLHRLDRLSGIGQFGVLFYGLDDGKPLDQPPAWIDRDTGKPRAGRKPQHNLLYVRPMDESIVRVDSIVKDPSLPRFGQPEFYTVNFLSDNISGESPQPVKYDTKVHWTRMQHVTDNPITSEVYGEPRIKPVANYLYDVRKVGGGSGEMFWRGGFPGFAFEAYPDTLGESDLADDEDFRDQIEAYALGMQRYLATRGGKWSSLSPQVADPEHHLQWLLNLISVTIGVPMRKFMGSEQGKLASGQDSDDWRTRLGQRQVTHVEPRILRPCIDRLMDFGCLPVLPNYNVAWRDLRALSDKDKADVGLKKVQALTQYVTGGVRAVFPYRLLYTLIMGFTETEADSIEERLKKELKENPLPEPEPAADAGGGTNGGGRRGNAFRAPAGRPGAGT